MRQALRPGGGGRPAADSDSIIAPVGGWNTINSVADMPEQDAVILDNWFPTPGWVQVRLGSSVWATGITGTVQTLFHYASPTAQKLFAANSSSIYDVTSTSGGSVGASVVSGKTNGQWQYLNFGTGAGNFLVAVNGADGVLNYNGTTWAVDSPAITGVAAGTSALIHVNAFKGRLYFVEKSSLRCWYLAAGAIGGAVAGSLDFSSICSRGGYLMAMATWTIDGGVGMDDLAVFLTSEGEVIVYRGTDPTTTATWSLVGVYYAGKPIGRRCFVKWGGDLAVMTHQGVVPMSQVLISYQLNTVKVNITNKIYPTILASALSYGANFGWQLFVYPLGQMLIVNVPVQGDQSLVYQYVMNLNTGAWCRFTGWNAACWELFNDAPFYGTAGQVVQGWTGQSDTGAAVQTDVLQAYSYFKSRGRRKHFKAARPIFNVNGKIIPALAVNVDYDNALPTGAPSYSGGSGAVWDIARWDVSLWSANLAIQKYWQTVEGEGYAGALRMRLNTANSNVQWLSTDWLFEKGVAL